MTHMPGVPIKFDPPDDWKPCHADSRCQKCKSANVRYRTHDSSCGGYEDDEIRCFDCGHTRWIDGPDA
jgi:hypothetical protein